VTDEQIRLYAECRVACPSGMIRLRSITEDGGYYAIVATPPPFFRAPRSEPRVVLPREGLMPPAEPRTEGFTAERIGIRFHHSLFWDHDPRYLASALAEQLGEAITRTFRQASIDIRL
jgi:hypothetical protein